MPGCSYGRSRPRHRDDLAGITAEVDTDNDPIDDTWTVSAAMDITEAGADTITITACGDMTGYRDDMVTFSFVEKSLTTMRHGSWQRRRRS